MNIRNKKILITGASSGLGLALKDVFSRYTNTIVTPLRSKGYDLATEAGQNKLITLLRENKPDIVINCAGFGLYGHAFDQSLEESRSMIRVNVETLTLATIASLDLFRKEKKKGIVMNIGSIAAGSSLAFFAEYAASKAFVSEFSKALDTEAKTIGCRVLLMLPGMFSSNFQRRASHGGLSQNSWSSLTSQTVALSILKQIEREKGVMFPSFLHHVLYLLLKMSPRSLMYKILQSSLKNRMT